LRPPLGPPVLVTARAASFLPRTMRDLLTAAGVAALLRVSRTTVWRLTVSGALPCERTPGGQARYRRADLDALIAGAP
jgi:excisionase family DNA binding protein